MNPSTYFGGIYKKPFKIFVTAQGDANKSKNGPETQKHDISVTNSHIVYEEVLNNTPESHSIKPPTSKSAPKPKLPEKRISFEKNKFLKACQENDLETLLTIDLSDPANLNVVDDYGWNGLMIAACANALDAFSFLLEKGIDFEHYDKSGRNSLQLAEKKGYHRLLNAFGEYVARKRGESLLEQDDDKEDLGNSESQSFHCDTCDMNFKETSRASHGTSVLHQFNGSQPTDAPYKFSYGIPTKNLGYQLMLKQGWNKKGLGPTETGRLYPVKTRLRNARSGLGTEQALPERVTHFKANDLAAIRYQPPELVKGRRTIVREYESNRQKEKRLRRALS